MGKAEAVGFDPGPGLFESGHLTLPGHTIHTEAAGAHLVDETQ